MAETELVEVTQDLIRELRASGRREEAADMLRAWRQNVEEAKKQAVREQNRVIRKKLRVIGKCTLCEKNYAQEGITFCFSCSERRKRYYGENREKILEDRSKYYQENKGKIHAYQRVYMREYRKAHREEINTKQREYGKKSYQKHREAKIEKMKAYYHKRKAMKS
jgi:hypothetical protein